MCQWPQLNSNDMTIIDLIEMHRALNLREYFEAEGIKREKAKHANSHR